MAWIKRNLVSVIFGVVTFALLALGGWYLYASIQRNDNIGIELGSLKATLNELHLSEPHPDPENIKLIKQDQVALEAFFEEARKTFSLAAPPAKLNDKQFKLLLENTIAGLHREAAAAGVQIISPKYSFTFAAQRDKLTYPPAAIEPWIVQLKEVTELCQVLFRAKVLYLESIRRIPVIVNREGDIAGPDFLGMQIATNSLGVFIPYEISFRGFGGEIVSVLEELQRATNCYIVKNIQIEQARVGNLQFVPQAAADAIKAATGRNPNVPLKDKDKMTDRYGNNNAPQPMPGVPPPSAVRSGSSGPQLTTILSEKPLRVVMLVALVKLKTDTDKK